MKIIKQKGTVIAEAETIAEALTLLAFETTHVEAPVRKYKRGGNNAWKGKHKVLCTTCGVSRKNIKLHTLKKHPFIYAQVYGKRIPVASLN